ncbi:unnamed protein product [Anisakis simplex]|uniref:Phosphomevalonate kinase n=1 Tax=Anisakis simplex TaxID=6269 RepID=A0A0M3JK04_ANISI|nr:unnamed protein product [Anisakis simplex]
MDSRHDSEQSQPHNRQIVVCISGKRKSGKDFVCDRLAKRLQMSNLKVVIRAISAPLKDEYASLFQLDSELLKTDAPYKELYRRQMVAWGEDIRRKDPSYFCSYQQEVHTNDIMQQRYKEGYRNQ